MERRFGRDFSRVRVHSGAAAEQSAFQLNASAYTAGNNIVFGARQLAPWTPEGRRLIAHELVHVLQQSSGAVRSIQRSPDNSKQTRREAWLKQLEGCCCGRTDKGFPALPLDEFKTQ
jgi:hypothetical protein